MSEHDTPSSPPQSPPSSPEQTPHAPHQAPNPSATPGFRQRLFEIIFKADTPEGKAFDVGLIWCILFSVGAVMLESMPDVQLRLGTELYVVEWLFTIIFTLEYLLRLYVVKDRKAYALSFFGLIDLLAILPTYMSLFAPGAQSLLVIRTFRLLRVFRIFKLGVYLEQANVLMGALRSGRPKIIVFLLGVSATVVSIGTIMYLIEGQENGFISIPTGIYWAIVTMTTVGFGDIIPQTSLGQLVASILMIMGYGIIAIPTGIVTTELVKSVTSKPMSLEVCRHCTTEGHDVDANFCKNCGHRLSKR